jgi:hypothetical protein
MGEAEARVEDEAAEGAEKRTNRRADISMFGTWSEREHETATASEQDL